MNRVLIVLQCSSNSSTLKTRQVFLVFTWDLSAPNFSMSLEAPRSPAVQGRAAKLCSADLGFVTKEFLKIYVLGLLRYYIVI